MIYVVYTYIGLYVSTLPGTNAAEVTLYSSTATTVYHSKYSHVSV